MKHFILLFTVLLLPMTAQGQSWSFGGTFGHTTPNQSTDGVTAGVTASYNHAWGHLSAGDNMQGATIGYITKPPFDYAPDAVVGIGIQRRTSDAHADVYPLSLTLGTRFGDGEGAVTVGLTLGTGSEITSVLWPGTESHEWSRYSQAFVSIGPVFSR